MSCMIHRVWIVVFALAVLGATTTPVSAQQRSSRAVDASAVQPLAGNPGDVKTRWSGCSGAEENANVQYSVGTTVYICVENFDPDAYFWEISGVSGIHKNIVIASGTFTKLEGDPDEMCIGKYVGDTGAHFGGAYVILNGDNGEYKVDVYRDSDKSKVSSDNYKVGGLVDGTKTASIVWEVEPEWGITKVVDENEHHLFAGQSGVSSFTVTVTMTVGEEDDPSVSGACSVHNSSKDLTTGPIWAFDCLYDDVGDLTQCEHLVGEDFPDGYVEIPPNTTCTKNFQYQVDPVLAGNTYENCLFMLVEGQAGLSTANGDPVIGDVEAYVEANDLIPLACATYTVPDEPIGLEVEVYDTFLGDAHCEGDIPEGILADAETFEYSCEYTCASDAGMFSNEAGFVDMVEPVEGWPTTDVFVHCYDGSKTANSAWDQGCSWEIEKTASPASWDLFLGDAAVSKYEINVKMTPGEPTFTASGVITVTHDVGDASDEPLALGVKDCVEPVGGGTPLACKEDFDPVVFTNGSVDIPYSLTFPPDCDADAQSGEPDYCGGEAYWNCLYLSLPGDITPDEPYCQEFTLPEDPIADIMVTDSYDGAQYGPFCRECADEDGCTEEYERPFTCDEVGEETHENTAWINESCDNPEDPATCALKDDAEVTVACHDLPVTKEADYDIKRSYEWTIDKTGLNCSIENGIPPSDECSALSMPIPMQPQQEFTVTYFVTMEIDSTDTEWKVSGDITVDNTAGPRDAEVKVSDLFAGEVAEVDCDPADGNQDEITVAAGSSKICEYWFVVIDPEDGAEGKNVATVLLKNYTFHHTDAPEELGDGTEFEGEADLEAAVIHRTDECAEVSDEWPEFASAYPESEVCFDEDFPFQFAYQKTFGPYGTEECDLETREPNTASFITNDTGADGDDLFEVIFSVPCPGCTLTQGYWKTHTILKRCKGAYPAEPEACHGPPVDETWGYCTCIGGEGSTEGTCTGDWMCAPDEPGELTAFFSSGVSWAEAPWRKVNGNKYWVLARQYVAAAMNYYANLFGMLEKYENASGSTDVWSASPSAKEAFDDATEFFMYCTPQHVLDAATVPTGEPAPDDTYFCDPGVAHDLASILAAFNEGCLGVEHCAEEGVNDAEICEVNGADKLADAEQVEADETGVSVAESDDLKPADQKIEAEEMLPTEFRLQGNYPNPFNPQTTILVDVPEATNVTLAVYDLMGRHVARVADGTMKAGTHAIVWGAGSLPSGTYFLVMQAADFKATHRLVLLK